MILAQTLDIYDVLAEYGMDVFIDRAHAISLTLNTHDACGYALRLKRLARIRRTILHTDILDIQKFDDANSYIYSVLWLLYPR